MNQDELFAAVQAAGQQDPRDAMFEAVSRPPQPIDLRERGFRHVTQADVVELEELARSPRGASGFKKDDIPFFGPLWTLDDAKAALAAEARVRGGTASREDELAVLRTMAEAQRDPTFGAKVADMLKSSATYGTELGVGLLAGGGLASIGAGAARQAAAQAGRRAFLRTAVGAGVAITGPEALPRLFGADGGRWRAESLQRALPELEGKLTDDQWKELERLSDETLPEWLEAKAPLWKGLVSQSIEVLSELAGGALAKIPLIAGARTMQAKAMAHVLRTHPKGVEGGLRALSRGVGIEDVATEMVEERLAAAAKAAVPGFEEDWSDVIPGAEDALAEFVAFSIPGLGMAGQRAVRERVKAAFAKRREEQQGTEAGGAESPGAAAETPAPEGGDPREAAPEADTPQEAEGVAASPVQQGAEIAPNESAGTFAEGAGQTISVQMGAESAPIAERESSISARPAASPYTATLGAPGSGGRGGRASTPPPDFNEGSALPPRERSRLGRARDWLQARLQDDTVAIREHPELRAAVKAQRAQGPARMEKFQERVSGLLKPLGKSPATLDDVQRAMYYQAALERNAWMREERDVEDGSGIPDAEAQTALDEIRARVGPSRLASFLSGVSDLNRERLDHLAETRVITPEQAERWHAREPHWVSMRDIDPETDQHVGFETSGRSIQVKNPQIRKAEGRSEELDNALLAWYSESLIRQRFAEKNRAMQQGAASGIPNVPKPEGVPGGFQPPDNYVAYVDQGEQRYLVMESKEAADALKGLNGEQLGFVLQGIGRLTRAFSRSVTGRNPAFWLPNFLRDSSLGVWTTAVEKSVPDAAKVLARSWAALPGLMRYQLTGKSGGVPLIEEARAAGFKTTWLGRPTLKEMLVDFKSQIEGGKSPAAMGRAALRVVDAFGDAFEMATRYASFVTEREAQLKNGATVEEANRKAGEQARELTLNFDTRGTWTPALSSLFAFFNPAVQGSAKLLKSILNGPRGIAAASGIVGLGAIMEVLGYALADDDDETGLNEYGNLAEHEKSRNIVFPMKVEGAYPKVTLPYGLDALYGAGRRIAHLASGGRLDRRKTAARVIQEGLTQAATSFSPLGDITDPYAMLTPTIAKPFTEIERNVKFGDQKVMKDKESFGRTLPDSARAFSTIEDRASGWLAQRIADVLNLNGPEDLPTGLDVSPESVQHIIEFLTAGFGLREIDRVSEFGLSRRRVEPAQNVPVLRNFATAVTSHYVSDLFYDIRDKSSALHGAAKDMAREDVETVRARDPEAWDLKSRIQAVDRQLGEMRKQINSGKMELEAERDLRDRMTSLQATVVRAYYDEKRSSE